MRRFTFKVSAFVAISLCIVCVCGCSLFRGKPVPNVLSAEEESLGWGLLWGGEFPPSAWADVRAGSTNFTAGGWAVANDALVASAGAEPIRTKTAFCDFDVKIDYRLSPGASASIIYFHNAETNVDTSVAYELAPPPPETDYEDAWQTARIVARRKSVTHWLDGRIVDRKTREDEELSGRIMLAPRSGNVEFRNMKVRVFGKW